MVASTKNLVDFHINILLHKYDYNELKVPLQGLVH